MSTPIIDVDRLTHSYGAHVALHELTLQIHAGEIFSLLGPNGSGKTTLFRILSTLIKPQDGRASILGYNLLTHGDAARREIGVVFQSPSLDKQLTARENLKYHGSIYGLDRRAIKTRSDDLLQRVGLIERADERVNLFSGGMRRRVEIAKALLPQPKLLLLDEPSTGLDPIARLEIWKYLDQVRTKDGVTVVLTTHLMDEADRSDRVAILDNGHLVACDSPNALKQKVGGDVVTLRANDSAAMQQLQQLLEQNFQLEPQAIGDVIRFERERAHEILPDVIESARGLVAEVSLGKPTLEDVFIRSTGRAFESE